MTDTILRFTSCYGCGVCAIACPVSIITVSETPDGFYSPVIHEKNKCIHCGLCLTVCAYNDGSVKTSDRIKTESYAAWSTDPLVRKECSSGGVGFAIAARLLREGYKACGVRYNITTYRAEHFVTSDLVAFEDSRGSKYLPSYTLPGFSEFNRKDRFLVTGTPCQIDSLRRWLRKTKAEDRYVLMDFFCHGVPSMHLWRKYLHHVSAKIENPVSIAWRDKKTDGMIHG